MASEKHLPSTEVDPRNHDQPAPEAWRQIQNVARATENPNNTRSVDDQGLGEGEVAKVSELKLYGRAVRERWGVSGEQRELAIQRVLEVLQADNAPYRARLAAAKVLNEIDRSNLEWARAMANIDDMPTIRLEIKRAAGDDPGAKILRERYRD